jgi:UDP-N-acetylmuramoylalanine--D-glutamate ligase
VAVANADDPAVMRAAAEARGRVVTFGLGAADFHVADGRLCTPDGEELAAVADLARALPHDLANALAASAAALAAGASLDGVRRALLGWQGFPHRMALVGDAGGVRWYDDSKATNPHASLAAIGSFPSVVLIAGGRNKGLDLSPLRDAAARIRSVVAIGEAAPEILAAFDGVRPAAAAVSMEDAVRKASAEARPGDVVLLSPACAAFDWYGSYAERGDHYATLVGRLLEETAGAGRD